MDTARLQALVNEEARVIGAVMLISRYFSSPTSAGGAIFTPAEGAIAMVAFSEGKKEIAELDLAYSKVRIGQTAPPVARRELGVATIAAQGPVQSLALQAQWNVLRLALPMLRMSENGPVGVYPLVIDDLYGGGADV